MPRGDKSASAGNHLMRLGLWPPRFPCRPAVGCGHFRGTAARGRTDSRTHPIPAQRGRPAYQRFPGRSVLPGLPPRRPPQLHRHPDLRELGRHRRRHLRAARSLHLHPQTDGNEIRLGCIATPGLIRCREMLLRGLFDSLRTKGGRLVSGKTRCCATTRTDVVDVAVGCLKDGCGSAISRAGVSD